MFSAVFFSTFLAADWIIWTQRSERCAVINMPTVGPTVPTVLLNISHLRINIVYLNATFPIFNVVTGRC
uniref:Secreted protein n=1 Tax=Anguilla anguilla TaxID=7936 RepID=A0A0E9WMZ4_ANGAN